MTDKQDSGQSKRLSHLFFSLESKPSNGVLAGRTMRTQNSTLLWYLRAPKPAGLAQQPTPCCQIFAGGRKKKHHFPWMASWFQIEKQSAVDARWLDHNKDDCSWIWRYKWWLFPWQLVAVCRVSTWKCLVPRMFFFCPVSTKKDLISQIGHKKASEPPARPRHTFLQRNRINKSFDISIMWKILPLPACEVSNHYICVDCLSNQRHRFVQSPLR